MCKSSTESTSQEELDRELKALTPSAPSERQKTAEELLRPPEQRKRQTLAGRLGVQQLRSALLNIPQ